MARPTRRDFLALSTAASIAALTRTLGGGAVRAGILGWGDRAEAAARVFHEIPGLTISSLSATGSRHSDALEFFRAIGREPPEVHGSIRSMIGRREPDFLYASGDMAEVSQWPGHLLLEGPADPAGLCSSGLADRCVQILPRFEFAEYGRTAAILRYDWRSARIDCRAPFPQTTFANSCSLARWLYRETGDAIDFAATLLGMSEPWRILGAATHAATPSSARFGWRVAEQRSGGKTMEVSLLASSAPDAQTEIHLWSRHGAMVLRGSPRSPILTRLLSVDLLIGMEKMSPERLLFSPHVLAESQRLISRFSEVV